MQFEIKIQLSNMFQHETQVRVRYSETDKMGYIYYGVYPQYFEVGRAEAVRAIGLTYRQLEDDYGILMPVMSMEVRYVRSAHYDDLLTLKTTLNELPTDQIVFHTDIYNENNKLICGGRIRLAFVEDKTKKRCPAPDDLINKLKPWFE